jgi:hypothetical protein
MVATFGSLQSKLRTAINERSPAVAEFVVADTASIKLTFTCPATLKTDLDHYAALHA